MISDSTLSSIRDAVSIVELVGEYVELKKSGQGYLGLCPFHNEKTPSFHVHPQRQCFHCFGCQEGGNIFTFLCKVEGLPFPDAVKKLAKRAGIELQETTSRRPVAPPIQGIERLTEALEWSTKYFHYLLTEVSDYKFALDYVLSRGITRKSIDRFRLGVSPRGWNTLLDLMLKRKFTFEELATAGLVVAKEGSPKKGYDRFRERLMFPIRSVEGDVIAFGARLLKDEPNQPKYLNSPESPLFSKRKNFYGLHENQRGIRLRGEAIIVEGYMDVVGLAEHGVNNAIATMGTALTEEHCAQLKGMTNRVVTVFDPDAGGQEAWRRSVHLFLTAGIFAKDLSLPDNLDPDEFILKKGAETFYQMCEKAPRQITKFLKEIASRGQLSEEESAKWLSELTPILVASRRLPDRAIVWDSISLVLKVSVDALKELSEAGQARMPAKESAKPGARTGSKPQAPPAAKPLDRLDLDFFEAVLHWPKQFAELSRAPNQWRPSIKEQRIGMWLDELSAAGITREAWATVLERLVQTEPHPKLQAVAAAWLFGAHPATSPPGEGENGSKLAPPDSAADPSTRSTTLATLEQRLRQRSKEIEIKGLSAQIKLCERMGNNEEGMKLLERLKGLRTVPETAG